MDPFTDKSCPVGILGERAWMMEKTHTCDRALALLKSYGINDVLLNKLIKSAEVVAETRGSPKLGFNHLIIAQGIPWSKASFGSKDI